MMEVECQRVVSVDIGLEFIFPSKCEAAQACYTECWELEVNSSCIKVFNFHIHLENCQPQNSSP